MNHDQHSYSCVLFRKTLSAVKLDVPLKAMTSIAWRQFAQSRRYAWWWTRPPRSELEKIPEMITEGFGVKAVVAKMSAASCLMSRYALTSTQSKIQRWTLPQEPPRGLSTRKTDLMAIRRLCETSSKRTDHPTLSWCSSNLAPQPKGTRRTRRRHCLHVAWFPGITRPPCWHTRRYSPPMNRFSTLANEWPIPLQLAGRHVDQDHVPFLDLRGLKSS